MKQYTLTENHSQNVHVFHSHFVLRAEQAAMAVPICLHRGYPYNSMRMISHNVLWNTREELLATKIDSGWKE
jgi:hypothetical protein